MKPIDLKEFFFKYDFYMLKTKNKNYLHIRLYTQNMRNKFMNVKFILHDLNLDVFLEFI